MKLRLLASIATISILSFTAITACSNLNSNEIDSSNLDKKEAIINRKPQIYTENNIAIRGADPVAYFTENKPVLGSDRFSYQWKDATWLFASAENRDLFASNPEKYAPQYGGFCAWAVSQGYTASIDPNAWKIVDGKLYLNYNRSVQRSWERDIPGNIAKADRNWPKILN